MKKSFIFKMKLDFYVMREGRKEGDMLMLMVMVMVMVM